MSTTNMICFNRETFYLYISIALLIIGYVLYQVHTSQLTKANDEIKQLQQEFKDEIQQQERHFNIRQDHRIRQIRDLQQVAHNIQHHEDSQRMFNPFTPPVKRGPLSYLGAIQTRPVNIPTRGEYGAFQQVGYLHSKDDVDQAMPLMGRRLNSSQWEYYTFHHNNPTIKIPIETRKQEIYADTELKVPGYNGDFSVKIYSLDHPRYIPY